jgi:hypothetical protein
LEKYSYTSTSNKNKFFHSKTIISKYFPLIIVGLLVVSSDGLMVFLNGAILPKVLPYFLLFLFGFFYLKKTIKDKINKEKFLLYIILVALIFISALIHQDFRGGYILILIYLSIAYFASELVSFDDYIEYSSKVIVFLSAVMILNFILRPLIFSSVIPLPRVYNVSGIEFVSFFGLSYMVDDSNYYRMFGFFREPGMTQIFINLVLIYELFFKVKTKLYKIIILYIALVLTFSSAGFLAGAIIIISYIGLIKNNNETRRFKKIILGALFFTVIMYLFIPAFSHSLGETTNKFFKKESSYVGRTSSVTINLQLWSENPIFGKGLTEGLETSVSAGEALMKSNYYANTSTITLFLLIFGMPLSLICIFLIGIFCLKSHHRLLVKISIFISLMIMFNSQALLNDIYFFSILFFALSKKQIID